MCVLMSIERLLHTRARDQKESNVARIILKKKYERTKFVYFVVNAQQSRKSSS